MIRERGFWLAISLVVFVDLMLAGAFTILGLGVLPAIALGSFIVAAIIGLALLIWGLRQ